mmetsp:Transcript_22159/g.58751  ORF Transcript_22159/g.58751 Transcript_22159/m.58751 type:complete len:95 (+) Transcript_22159:349-633(+)
MLQGVHAAAYDANQEFSGDSFAQRQVRSKFKGVRRGKLAGGVKCLLWNVVTSAPGREAQLPFSLVQSRNGTCRKTTPCLSRWEAYSHPPSEPAV